MLGSVARAPSLGPLGIVLALYYTSILLEMVETWLYPIATVTLLVLAAVALRWINRATILLFLGAATIYFLAFRFPEVANHVNLIVFVNLAIIAATLHSLATEKAFDPDGFYERLAPILRLSIIVTFSVAGFHKLNADFIDPAVSCITDFTFENTVLRLVLMFGISAAAATATKPAIIAYSIRSWPWSSFQKLRTLVIFFHHPFLV